MNSLALRARDNTSTSARVVARRFLDHLLNAQVEEARALAAHSFSWLGRRVLDSDWTGHAERFFSETRSSRGPLKHLPRDVLSLIPEPFTNSVLDGPLEVGDVVFLVDVERGPLTVTIGLIATAHHVKRVFDPTRFARVIETLTTPEGSG